MPQLRGAKGVIMATMKKTAAATKKDSGVLVKIPELRRGLMSIRCTSISDLIVHNFNEKTRREIEQKLTKKAMGKKTFDSKEEYNLARYVINGKDHIKTIAFKLACQSIAARFDGITGTMVKQGMFILGDFVEIKGCKPEMFADIARTTTGRPYTTYRPKYKNWYVNLDIEYNPDILSAEQICHLLDHAGFSCGVGDNRPMSPMKTGPYGRFTIREATKSKTTTRKKTTSRRKAA
jgi:hypothetical protein